ncbi:MAG: hypothetical protein DRR19_24915 [Candidatus Parabeggiatoa sp. nov. 1]|nr:MAG: hypothetical protein DRR19_24915 [Gammaproteobacteria bacterium]
MKKLILKATVLATVLPVTSALAVNNVGCGLGSMLFEGQSGLVPQVLAVTTNGTFGNQTFGITSGTLGCSQHGVVSVPAKVAEFTGDNLDKLARDMAAGTGELLNSLAVLMEVDTQHKPAFFNATHTHFAQIFPTENVTAEDVLVNLNKVLTADPILKRYSFS